ncbi:MAG: DUF362 domain-containing protein [Deltaproteobacteria bacterium]|nr:DUF362 domain-containing protein [Deltaproteobacteria bacterium]MBW2285069.1 DUF362 domain-containing protein [Deltaproteobacteria bacterium]
MKRREFLEMMAGAIALALVPGSRARGSDQTADSGPSPEPGPATDVFVAGVPRDVPQGDLKRAARETAEAADDFSWLSKGDTVFIKPALNSGNPYPATTSPTAVAAVVELLKDRGAGRVLVGDMCGVEHVKLTPEKLTGSSRQLMKAGGMAQAVERAGAELHFFEEDGWNAFYEDYPVNGAHWKGPIMMPNILKEVDHIVLMPRCARHILAGSTLGLKAAVGWWRYDTRLEYHHDAADFHEKTAEGNAVSTLLDKQRLVISAADKTLTTFGPDKGYVSQPETGLIMASSSVVAHDMVSLAWLLDNWENTPETEKGVFSDPYTSQFAVTLANHMVVKWLGGWKQAFSSQKLIRKDINTLMDDRALTHAYRVFGGRPKVILNAANDGIPDELKNRLGDMTNARA